MFQLVLKDENISTAERECINERNKTQKEISEQELLISKIRRRFLEDKIDFDDFSELKKECKEALGFLNDKITIINERLSSYCAINNGEKLIGNDSNLFQSYKNQDLVGKRFILELFTPSSFDPITKELHPLQINQALSIITTYNISTKQLLNRLKNKPMEQISNNNSRLFSDRKVSIDQAIKILRKNGTETTSEQAIGILDFLYLLAKTHHDQGERDAYSNK